MFPWDRLAVDVAQEADAHLRRWPTYPRSWDMWDCLRLQGTPSFRLFVGDSVGLKSVAQRRPEGRHITAHRFNGGEGPKETPSPGRDGICDPNVRSAAALILSPTAEPQSLP